MLEPQTSVPASEAPLAFLEQKTFNSRTIILFGTIDQASAGDAVRRLVALAAESDAPIQFLLSSPGGHLESGDALHDVIRYVGVPVYMIGAGWVGSAATHAFLAAPRERRVCLPNTRFLIHQPSGGAGGRASEMETQAVEIVKARRRIAEEISGATGRPLEQVLEDIERDRWMSPVEAIEYGLLSRVIRTRSELA